MRDQYLFVIWSVVRREALEGIPRDVPVVPVIGNINDVLSMCSLLFSGAMKRG